MFKMDTKVDLVNMDPNNPIHKWFLDHDSALMSCGNASSGFFGILNYLTDKKWNVTLYKVMFKSHINVMTEDTFQHVQKSMEPLYDLFSYKP